MTKLELKTLIDTFIYENVEGEITASKMNELLTVIADSCENVSVKGAAYGYPSLDASGLVPANQLPSYVDDVLEVASFSELPTTGERGKIYILLDTGKTYRWSGSAYLEIRSEDPEAIFTSTTTSNFVNILDNTVLNVQTALEKIDEVVQDKLDLKSDKINISTRSLMYFLTIATSDVSGFNILDRQYNEGLVQMPFTGPFNIATPIKSFIASADNSIKYITTDVITNKVTFSKLGEYSTTVLFKLFERDMSGTETLIATSPTLDIVNLKTTYEFTYNLSSFYTLATGSRLVVKMYANTVGNTTLTLYTNENGSSFIGVPTLTSDIEQYAKKNNVLEKNNIAAYEPTLAYHPTPKIYVDTAVNSVDNQFSSGTYSPGYEVISSNTTFGISRSFYIKAKNVVTCYMVVAMTGVSGGTGIVHIGLPFGTTVSSQNDIIGVVGSRYGYGYILGSTSDNMANLVMTFVSAVSQTVTLQFVYKIQ